METCPPSGTAWLCMRGEDPARQLGLTLMAGASGLSADDRSDSGLVSGKPVIRLQQHLSLALKESLLWAVIFSANCNYSRNLIPANFLNNLSAKKKWVRMQESWNWERSRKEAPVYFFFQPIPIIFSPFLRFVWITDCSLLEVSVQV